MPISNGGLGIVILFHSAYGATSCNTCYRCEQYSGSDCVRCVYDPNYCGGSSVGDCRGLATWDYSRGKCVCNAFQQNNKAWTFFDNSDDVCDSITMSCVSGQFPGSLYSCSDCAIPNFNPVNNLCAPKSDIKYASDLDDNGLIAQTIYNGCYLAQGCVASDEMGTFELVGDCRYSVGGAIVGPTVPSN